MGTAGTFRFRRASIGHESHTQVVALLAACGAGSIGGGDSASSPSETTLDGPDDSISQDLVKPCKDFVTAITSDLDAATAAVRHGLDAEATVLGSGEITGYGCMAGTDTGVQAIIVHRRIGDEAYSDYIVASGEPTIDWADWFEVTQPETEIRPFVYGWTTEPEGLSEGLPAQPVWAVLAEGIE